MRYVGNSRRRGRVLIHTPCCGCGISKSCRALSRRSRRMSPEIAAAPLPDVGVLLHGLPSEDLCLDFLQAISDDGELPQLLPPSGKGGGTQAGQAAAAPANATAASAPPSAGGEPYGRQWGWNADALTVQRNEHTPVSAMHSFLKV